MIYTAWIWSLVALVGAYPPVDVPREWNGELTEFKDGSFLCMRSVVPEPSGVIKVHIIEVIE